MYKTAKDVKDILQFISSATSDGKKFKISVNNIKGKKYNSTILDYIPLNVECKVISKDLDNSNFKLHSVYDPRGFSRIALEFNHNEELQKYNERNFYRFKEITDGFMLQCNSNKYYLLEAI